MVIPKIPALARYARNLPRYLREPLSGEGCLRWIETSRRQRVANFLGGLQRVVFAHPASVYARLLAHAGIGFADIEAMVRRDGIESTLGTLFDAGVHLQLDEFKGRKPIVRGSLVIDTDASAFDNTLFAGEVALQTGGSRSEGTRVYVDLDHYATDARYDYAYLLAHGHLERPYALWRPTPPYGAGIKAALSHLKLGLPLAQWFSQRPVGWEARGKSHRALLAYTLWASRLTVHRLPRPRHVSTEHALIVARWLAEQCRAGKPGLLNTTASSGVRVASAALEHGLDIAGSFMRFGGEPFSAGKALVIARAGVRAGCHYTMGETGRIGVACANPQGPDDVHMLDDKIAVITRPRATGGGTDVQINVHTSILPMSPKYLLNVESDDYGVLEERACGCALEGLGYRLHMREIRSVDKLTSEGMTFIGNDLVRLVEEILPRTFGGEPTDWQFVEREENGLPRVEIRAAPRIGPLDEAAVIDRTVAFLNAIPRASDNYGERWREARTLRLVRQVPLATGAAKLMALHIDRQPG